MHTRQSHEGNRGLAAGPESVRIWQYDRLINEALYGQPEAPSWSWDGHVTPANSLAAATDTTDVKDEN
ncbi:hypothetical protein [Ralstonia solanacearum]|uniref:hypothetical protein n=1 Tax=Ralstonia solanacearum TaxID=305 RepID=UPI001112A845|nr:hypothetical protein [Ralstonia solanacearum]